jgi:hypothetical protein
MNTRLINRILNQKTFLVLGFVLLVALSTESGAKQYIPHPIGGGYPVIRYCNSELPQNIRGFVDYIDFQAVSSVDASVYLYFKGSYRLGTWARSEAVSDFIRSKPEWTGDRSRNSVTAEILTHWIGDNARPILMSNPITAAIFQKIVGKGRLSPVRPAHIQYFYAGLGKWEFWKYL